MKRIAHWYQSHIVLILNMTHNLHNRIQTENRTSLFMKNNNLRRIKQFAFNEIHNGPYIKQSIFISQFYCVTNDRHVKVFSNFINCTKGLDFQSLFLNFVADSLSMKKIQQLSHMETLAMDTMWFTRTQISSLILFLKVIWSTFIMWLSSVIYMNKMAICGLRGSIPP